MKPESQQIIEALPHVFYEIQSLLLTPKLSMRKDDPSYEAVVESIEFRKMAHARLLYTFFTRKAETRQIDNLNDDDVLCEDYGFPAEPLYGADPKPLLDRFNKDLFHLTYTRLKRTPETKHWPIEKLRLPVETRSRRFIDHIIDTKVISIPDAERNRWRELKHDDATKLPLQQHTSNIAPVNMAITEVHRGT